ncbi:MAG TPA: hypothetical protein VI485_18470 [Vicinamibacterales bacterium]|nr:hypothetical protein [Vicinamibacterales bacterium]
MKHLKVWQKLALMGAIFMAPFAVVTYKMTSSINALGVESARMEVQGLAYYAPAVALVKDLQLHRDIAHAWLTGDASFKDALTAKRTEIDNDITALDAVDERLNGLLHTSERWATVRTACNDILNKTPASRQNRASPATRESSTRSSRSWRKWVMRRISRSIPTSAESA